MLSLFSLLENIYSGSRLALLPPCDCGLLWLLVLLLIGNLKRLVMLRCQAAALPSRAKPGQACNWCVAIEVFAMHGCLCLEAASASASASASAWASAQVALCVCVCWNCMQAGQIMVTKFIDKTLRSAYCCKLCSQATSIATLRIRNVTAHTRTHTYAHNIILQTEWQAIERLRQWSLDNFPLPLGLPELNRNWWSCQVQVTSSQRLRSIEGIFKMI